MKNQITQSQIAANAKAAQEARADEHSKKMELQDKVNEGMLGKTIAGESIKAGKEENVAHIKTDGANPDLMKTQGTFTPEPTT